MHCFFINIIFGNLLLCLIFSTFLIDARLMLKVLNKVVQERIPVYTKRDYKTVKS